MSKTSPVWDHHTADNRIKSLQSSSIYIFSDRMQLLNCESAVQVKVALLKFLKSASEFYESLAMKLQATFGDAGFTSTDTSAAAPAIRVPRTLPHALNVGVDVKISVYRCLICLGDLARWACGGPIATVHAIAPLLLPGRADCWRC